jgi:hypothetical protein
MGFIKSFFTRMGDAWEERQLEKYLSSQYETFNNLKANGVQPGDERYIRTGSRSAQTLQALARMRDCDMIDIRTQHPEFDAMQSYMHPPDHSVISVPWALIAQVGIISFVIVTVVSLLAAYGANVYHFATIFTRH